MTTELPQLTVLPSRLSLELHFLNVLTDDRTSPTSRIEALRRIRGRYPDYTGLGKQPETPTDQAVKAWDRLIERPPGGQHYVEFVQHGHARGLILTPAGVERRDTLWENQVFAPFQRRVRDAHGDAVADALVAQEHR
ncbi:hypothetical protein [Deinococcus sp. Leaf326]|uniref:hypothetical protein n=1 Tax=Deinococcus sp. Leaf326 TaxID=1736338 RepID=UPI000B282AE2|nr:hypothetical protein [Deinococcus sp. Leaf326]